MFFLRNAPTFAPITIMRKYILSTDDSGNIDIMVIGLSIPVYYQIHHWYCRQSFQKRGKGKGKKKIKPPIHLTIPPTSIHTLT